MKIRFDFVTNSSSSSFVICRINNKTLAKLYSQAGLGWKLDGKDGSVIRERFDSEDTDMSVPDGQSISEWMQSAIQQSIFINSKQEYQNLIILLKQYSDEVDYDTRTADFVSITQVRDGGGSCFSSEERKAGKIIFTGFGEDDWDYQKENEGIDDFLDGDVDEIRRKSKELCGTEVQDDPWFKNEDVSDIYDSPAGFSFVGEVVCLTGDFDYGSKDKVAAFIVKHGGSVSSSVTRKTTVVLQGNKGSEAWSHGSYGTKIEKAIERKNTRDDILILKEDKCLFVD